MNLPRLFPLIIIVFYFNNYLSAQSTNDYRSIGSGNWTNTSIWEVYNGTIWVAATTYPGQVANTNDVSIEGGFSVTLSSNIPSNFNSLTVGDGTGVTDTLLVSATSSLETLLWTIADGGFASWTTNVTFSLPAGAAVLIIPTGSLDTSNPCSAARRLVIGTTIYATCNGGAGADFSFEQLNNQGGSMNVTPSSNAPICVGETLNLFANPSGAGSGGGTFSWSATGPGGYSFSSTLENPTETGLFAGSYIYSVTITNGSNSVTNSITLDVGDSPNPPVSGGNQTACSGAVSFPSLMVTVGVGETADWYDASSGGTLLLSGNTTYTPTVAGSYYAEARNNTTGCTSTGRIEITLKSRSCKVITNRRITYRVIK